MTIAVDNKRIRLNYNDVIAVCNDNGTQSITFSIPLSSSTYDIRTLTPFVVYKPHGANVSTTKTLSNKTVVGDNLFVTWNMDASPTISSGELQFQIVLSDNTTDPSPLLSNKRWATKICKVNIPSSLF